MRRRASLIALALLASWAWAAPEFASASSLVSDEDLLLADFEQALVDYDQAQEIQATDPDGARRLFRSAARRFSAVAAAGVDNGYLEYNLGNAYLQSGDVGRAILHYRRGHRLIPRDQFLQDNLQVARSKCLVSIPPSRRSSLLRGLFFLHYETSMAGRARVALILYLAVWLVLIVGNFVARRPTKVAAAVCAALSLSLFLSIGISIRTDRNTPAGVVIATDVVVNKGPGASYERQFVQPLQSGVEFVVREKRGGWWNVELPDGQTGWIEGSHAQLVVPDIG